jgi:iron-sulfur cluster assembly protein
MPDSINDIILTEKAVLEIKAIMEENNIPVTYGLRISIKAGECCGYSYQMNFDPQSKTADTIITQDGINIFVDGKSLFYLMGTTLDYQDGKDGKGFVFNNPNDNDSCGCGC